MPMNQQLIHIACVPQSELHPDDDEVSGVYQILVDQDISPEKAVSIALDVFHTSIGIRVLDHFEITAHDVTGRLLPNQDEDHEPYSGEGMGDFCGRIGDDLSVFESN